MAYDDIINKNQGSMKASESFTDRPLDIISTQIGESGIKVLEQLIKISGDALRRVNYILLSDGRMRWDGNILHFDSDSRANDMIFRLLQTETAAPRTINLKLTGSTTGNTTNTFQDLTLSDGDLIYLELDRATVLGSAGTVVLENAVSGGSIISGYTVKKVNVLTGGMPALLSPEAGPTQTFYIPICLRHDWTDGIDTFQDLLWPAHGIRWPAGISSTVGEVIVRGLETLPSTFVRSQTELQTAITDLTVTGGIILVSQSFVIDTSITIPPGITLCGRSSLADGGYILGFAPGGYLSLGDEAYLKDLSLSSNTFFGTTSTESIVRMQGTGSVIENCWFWIGKTDTGPFYAECIHVYGNSNRIIQCKFGPVNAASWRTGINFDASGLKNAWIDILTY